MQLKKRRNIVRLTFALVAAGILLVGIYLIVTMKEEKLNVVHKVASNGYKRIAAGAKRNDRLKNIEKLEFGKSVQSDVLANLGEPDSYVCKGKTVDRNNLPDQYVMVYGEVYVLMSRDVLGQINITEPGVFVKGVIQVGSSREDAFKVLGKPRGTAGWKDSVQGKLAMEGSVPFTDIYKDRVIYTDFNGVKGTDYYPVYSMGISIAFINDTVGEIDLRALGS